MAGKSTIDQIKHYQKDIERCPDNAERMMRCIHRLYILPITLEHLQITGVGRSVNSLRKYKGEVGDAAKALVTKWKAMVAAEESGDEANVEPASRSQEVPSSHPVNSVKAERKTDHNNKEKSSSKDLSNKHHKKSSHSDRSHSSDTKPHDKYSESKSSSKRSHSSSSNNHISEKDSKHSKRHKSHHDKKRSSTPEDSPPPEKKHKSSHSHNKERSSHSKKREVSSSESSEEEEYDSEVSDSGAVSDNSPERNSEEESDVASSSSKSDDDSNSSSSSDHRHKSKHKSSHHNHKHSSHSKVKEKEKSKSIEKKHKEKERDKSKARERDKDKNKENREHNKHSEKHSNKKTSSSSHIKELIKENEGKVKKEKKDEFVAPKPVKLETNEDGSIDNCSGASFADALLGMDSFEKKKSKKSGSSSGGKSPTKSSKGSSSSSSSQCSAIKQEERESKARPSSSHPKTIDELVEPPELLTKKLKLEALDLDLASTLPEINPNYKPLPHVPERSRPKIMTAEDHMFSIMTTKNQRTKVFSGNKAALTSVPTLFSMCIQLLYENIDAVEYTGGVPFQLLKPLLEKLNADQLYVLEHFNPYLIEDTDELWKFHCGKEFRTQKRQDMESWRELYVRCMDEREKKLKALTANITQSMAKSTPVRQAKLAYVDTVVKPPRNVARKQAKYGTGSATTIATKNPTKQEIVSKAIVGGNTPGISVKDTVPTPPPVARAAAHHPTPALLKKKKAPLMQKALQVMKGTRYKR